MSILALTNTPETAGHGELPTTPPRHIHDDRVTISITLPRSVVDRNRIDVTLTPHSQRTATAYHLEGYERIVEPPTPSNTPRHRVPHFELPVQATPPRTPTNNGQIGDDPFQSEPNVRRGANVRGPTRDRDTDVGVFVTRSDDDDDNFPNLVYPLPSGGLVEGLPNIPRHPNGYFVVTAGKKIGVFYDSWYVFI